MSFDKLILPDFMLAGLYKDELVLIENDLKPRQIPVAKKIIEKTDEPLSSAQKQQVEIPAQLSGSLTWLGNNTKHISIIVNDSEAIHLQDGLLDILSAILSACKLNLADVAIVNAHTQEVKDDILRQQLSPRVVLLFGIETATINLPFSIPLYKTQAFNNCTYLQAVSLEQMKGASNEAKLEKSKLWVCLKTIFGI